MGSARYGSVSAPSAAYSSSQYSVRPKTNLHKAVLIRIAVLWYLVRPIDDHGVQLPTTQSLIDDHIPASLQFEDVSYTLPQHSFRILDNVSGSVQPGQLLAIMGASGSGKSTLLDILARRHKRGLVSGAILINGRTVSNSVFRRAAGYVDQEETLMSTLTVYETVYYSALLRLPREMTARAKHIRTLETLDELGILDIKDQYIGDSSKGHRGISGGEKRRVSIACELVTSPSIIFLDEPTSGLDAYSALSVVEGLHRLAREYNRTVVFTIHQPRSNIVALFDKLIMLAKGRVMYSGEMVACQQYFAEVGFPCPAGFNIADYLGKCEETQEKDMSNAELLLQLIRRRSATMMRRWQLPSLGPLSSKTHIVPLNSSHCGHFSVALRITRHIQHLPGH